MSAQTPGQAPGRARNRRGEGGRLGDEIVSAALDLLDETGDSHAVTLRAVARRVGVTAPSLYAHFPDRQAILLAATRRAFLELHRELRDAIDGAGADPAERLLAGCTAYLDFARARPQRYLVMFGGVWDASVAVAAAWVAAHDVAELGQAALDEITACITACRAAGLTIGAGTATDPATDAVVLWVGLHGLAHQRIVSKLFTWPDDVEATLLRRLTGL